MLLSGLLFLGAFIMIFAAIRPAMDKVNEKRVTLESSERVLQEKTEVVENINTLIVQLRDELSSLQRSVDMALPEKEELTAAINQLDGILRRSRPSFISASISVDDSLRTRQPDDLGIGYLNFSINLEGDYESVKEFIRLLETNIRVFDVETLSIVSSLSEEELFEDGETEETDEVGTIPIVGEPLLKVDIKARAFFQNKQRNQ